MPTCRYCGAVYEHNGLSFDCRSGRFYQPLPWQWGQWCTCIECVPSEVREWMIQQDAQHTERG